MQTVQKVLSLARNLKSKDWISAMEKETDRHAVVRLHNNLRALLGKSDQTNRED
jgi:protein-arginine kinase